MKNHELLGIALALGIIGTASVLAAQPSAPAQPGAPAQPTAPAQPSAPAADSSLAIHQEVDFTASPERLYLVLLDSRQFAEFSGRPARIDRKIGGECRLFDEHIFARNVELVPNRRIVQAWRSASWPEGTWSIVRFELTAQGTGTHLVLDHTGFPQDQRDHLWAGWDANYWSPLKKYFH